MSNYAAIAVGGAIGAVARYFLSGVVHDKFGAGFPYGTLAVNVLGCFLLGLILQMTETRYILNPQIKMLLTVGILGGFTTFSTYSYETLALVRDGLAFQAAVNVVGSLGLGLIGAWAGIVAGRLI